MTALQFDSLAEMSVEQLEAWQELHKALEQSATRAISVLEGSLKEMTGTAQLVAKLIVAKKAGRDVKRLRP